MKWWEGPEYDRAKPMDFPEPGTRRTRRVTDGTDPVLYPNEHGMLKLRLVAAKPQRPKRLIHLGPSFR